MQKSYLIIIAFFVVCLIGGGIFFTIKNSQSQKPVITPTPTPIIAAQQLPVEDQPEVSLQFSADGHYVTVGVTNIHADQIEYNLIYEATVKSNTIQTGVNASSKLNGTTTFTQRQLLGSESSGKFTYHQNIKNAVMELALRDSMNRSVFTGNYPFTVLPGETVKPSLQ